MTANLAEIQALASDIAILAYHTGLSLTDAAQRIEAEMDGTQPADLIGQAIALATTRAA